MFEAHRFFRLRGLFSVVELVSCNTSPNVPGSQKVSGGQSIELAKKFISCFPANKKNQLSGLASSLGRIGIKGRQFLFFRLLTLQRVDCADAPCKPLAERSLQHSPHALRQGSSVSRAASWSTHGTRSGEC